MATTPTLPKTADKVADAVVDAAVATPKAAAAIAEAAPLAAAAVIETVAKLAPEPKRAAAKAKPARKPAVAKRAKPAKTVKAAAKTARTPIKSTTKTIAAKAAPTTKGKTMTDTVKTMTAQGEKIVSELKTRATDTVAKSKAMFADAGEFNKGNLEALVESGKIAAKGFEKLGQDAADYARKSFEHTTMSFKGMASVKSPTDLLKMHSDYVRSSFDMFVAEASRSTEASLKLAGEIAQPLSNRFAVAAEKVKLAA